MIHSPCSSRHGGGKSDRCAPSPSLPPAATAFFLARTLSLPVLRLLPTCLGALSLLRSIFASPSSSWMHPSDLPTPSRETYIIFVLSPSDPDSRLKFFQSIVKMSFTVCPIKTKWRTMPITPTKDWTPGQTAEMKERNEQEKKIYNSATIHFFVLIRGENHLRADPVHGISCIL